MLGYGQPSQQAQPQVIFGEPSDTGFTCISRRRAFQVFLRRDCGRFIREPAEIYHQLCSGLGARHLTLPELCQVMTEDDFQHELALSGKSVDSYPASFLSNFESSNKGKYEALLGDADLNLQAYVLNQNPDHIKKYTKCGLIPTFTKADKITWIPERKRHLLALEKYVAHGWPVNSELAEILKVPAPRLPYSYIYINEMFAYRHRDFLVDPELPSLMYR